MFGYAANNTTSPPGVPLSQLNDSQPYNVWAEFVQVDIPIFGDNLNIPLVRKLDLEGSFRHDSYHGTLAGSTSNPKVAFTWLVDDVVGLTVRGSWGTSFRFANAGEYSTVLSDANGSFNTPGQPTIRLQCAGGVAPAGSLAGDLVAAGVACNSTPIGDSWGGGPHPELRNFTNPVTGQIQTREGGVGLAPEKANNYSVGFEFAPQFEFLRGLGIVDLTATRWFFAYRIVLVPFATAVLGGILFLLVRRVRQWIVGVTGPAQRGLIRSRQEQIIRPVQNQRAGFIPHPGREHARETLLPIVLQTGRCQPGHDCSLAQWRQHGRNRLLARRGRGLERQLRHRPW